MNSINQPPTSDRRKEKKTGHQFQEGPPPRQENIEELARKAIQSSLDLSRRIEQFEQAMVSEQFLTVLEIAKLLEQPETSERISRQVSARVDDLQHAAIPGCCDARDELRKDTHTMVLLLHHLEKFQRLLSEKQK